MAQECCRLSGARVLSRAASLQAAATCTAAAPPADHPLCS